MKITIEELLLQFLNNQLSIHTKRAYECDVRSFLNEYSDRKLDAVTTDDVAVYRDRLLQNSKPATVARRLTVIRQFFSFCMSAGLLKHNPVQTVRSPKVSQHSTTNGLTKEQAESLLRQPNKAILMGKRDYAILQLMLNNGLRNSEVTKIRWGDFGQERGHVVLNIHGKGGKESITKIKPKVMAAIEGYVQDSGREMGMDSPLFVGEMTNSVIHWNRIGQALSAGGIRYMVKKYAKMAGIGKRISPHSLRHTCVTLCLDGGGTIRHAMYLARHAQPGSTTLYDRHRNNLDDHGTDYIRLDA